MKYSGLTLVALVTLTASLRAGTPAESPEEAINYLLNYIATSDRIFIRNGQEHSAAEAAKLMRYKYDSNKKAIHSPEDFIRVAATKSSTTGKPYLVKLADGKTIPAADWLMDALEKHRGSAQKTPQ